MDLMSLMLMLMLMNLDLLKSMVSCRSDVTDDP